MKTWERCAITWDRRVNRSLGPAQWLFQESWALFFLRWIALQEQGKDHEIQKRLY
jgi:hypothetical protein